MGKTQRGCTIAILLLLLAFSGCVGGGDAGRLKHHTAPLKLNATSSTGSGWTNPSAAATDGDDTYAATSTDERWLWLVLANSTFTATITKVTLKVDQQQANANQDKWGFFLYESTCGTIALTNPAPVTTSTRKTLSADATCPNGWTWLRIANLAAFVVTDAASSVDGEWRVYHAWIEVTISNNVPTASAGTDQTATETTLVTLDGQASADPDGARDPLTYAWSQQAGPAVVLVGPTTATPTFTAPTLDTNVPVSLVFQLTVTDPNEDASSGTVTVTVQNVNRVPVANAGPDQSVDESTPVTLTGGSSSDPDGDPFTYSWNQTGGPLVSLSDATVAQPTFAAPSVPTQASILLTFQLTVRDGFADSIADTVVVTVLNVNAAPVADAGPDQAVDEDAPVTLEGSAVDADGDSVAYAWSQTEGTPVLLSDATSAAPTFTAPQVPTNEAVPLRFQLVANDGLASSAPDTVTVAVNNINQAPAAEAGPNQTVEESAQVTLDASGSTDADLDPLTFLWTQTQGPAVALTDATASRPSFTTPTVSTNEPVVLAFRLDVADGIGATAEDTVVVTVLNVNQAPIAQAGADQTVEESSPVQLSGTASNDAEGDVLTYQWTQTAGPAVVLQGPDTAAPSFTAPTLSTNDAALLAFRLIVGDGVAFSEPDLVAIEVTNANEPPVASAGPDRTVDEGALVSLDGAGSTDGDSDVLAFTWIQTGGPAVTLSTSGAQATFTAPTLSSNTPVELTFSLVVHDGFAPSPADAVRVTVLNVNSPPVVDAGAAATVDEGESVVLAANATDDDGDVLDLAWEQVGGPSVTLAAVDSSRATFAAPSVPTNEDVMLRFRVSASDRIADSVTDEAIVTVRNVNQAPVASAGAWLSVSEETGVALNGSAVDPDQDPMTLSWTQETGPPVVLENDTRLDPSFLAPALDTNTDVVLEFRLVASDGQAPSAPGFVRVTVRNVNRAPAALVGAHQIVDSGALVVLDGSSSSDPDGDAVAYAWTQGSGSAVELAGGDSARPTFTAPAGPEILVFGLAVTDALAATSGVESAIVMVNAPQAPPVAATTFLTATSTVTEAATTKVVRLMARPSSALLQPGERVPVGVVVVPADGAASAIDASASCSWDASEAGGSYGPGSSSCQGMFSAGSVPGQDYHLDVDVSLAGTGAFSLSIPILVGLTMEAVANSTGQYDLGLPPVLGGQQVPISFPPGYELDLVLLLADSNMSAGTRLETRRLAVMPGDSIPGTVTPPAFVLEISLFAAPGETEVPRVKASLQFSVQRQWLDAYCPPAACDMQMFHFAGDLWTPLPTTKLLDDAASTQFLSPTDSFSVFAAAGVPKPVAPDTPGPGAASNWIALVAVVAGALAISVGASTVLIQRRRAAARAEAPGGRRFGELIRAARHKEVLQFVSSAAHDLATPLSTLNIQLHLLLTADPEHLKPDQKRAFETMGRNLDQLRRLVSDLNDAARQHAGRLALFPVSTDVAALAKEIAQEYGPRSDKTGVGLEVAVPDAANAVVDPHRLRQVLGNLLNNAFRFTPRGGTIRLVLEEQGADLLLRVEDTGLGFTEDQGARLFEPFVQVHGADMKRQGTGLGLFICKGIVEAHGGRIRAESRGPGAGATFHVLLPRGGPVQGDSANGRAVASLGRNPVEANA